MAKFVLAMALAALAVSPSYTARIRAVQQDPDPPKILLDQSLRAVEYQLNRLTSDQLVRVERNTNDAKYRPVYAALLTRKGVPAAIRDEAVAALVKFDKTNATRVLLDALAKIPVEDGPVADKLVGLLLAQSGDVLRAQRDTFVQAAGTATQPFVLRGAYGALMLADAGAQAAWQTAAQHDGHLVELLRSVPLLPGPVGSVEAASLRSQLVNPITALINNGSADAIARAEALSALASLRKDPATLALLARELVSPLTAKSSPETRAAAIRAIQTIPEGVWQNTDIESLAKAILALVKAATPDERTEPPVVDALQLGDRLAAALPDEPRRRIRQELRTLGVQIVRIETVPEQMLYDVKWFVAEAGSPVQVVLFNKDSMPHNLIIGKPKSIQELGVATLTMSLPTDPAVKPYVPAGPLVLYSTNLLKEGETAKLGFTAPAEPGEYVYLCSFPGHYLRMYGVMLVVASLDAWEAHPTVPIDPMTGSAFLSKRNGGGQER